MKYTKLLTKIKKVANAIISVFFILIILGLVGVYAYVEFVYLHDVFSLMWLILIPTLAPLHSIFLI